MTLAEYEQLCGLFASLDQTCETTRQPQQATARPTQPTGGLRPGDDWMAQTDWADLLQPRGWTLHKVNADTEEWSRPGKTPPGCSATLWKDTGRLYVFSTNADLPPGLHDKLDAYAHWHHGANLSAAAAALAQAGYGTPAPETEPTLAGLHPNWATHTPPEDAQTNLEDRFTLDVAAEAHRIRVREAARNLITREKLTGQPGYDVASLAELLARPQDPPFRVEELIPSEAGTLLVAMRKTGKTTFALNLARALITGQPFLEAFNTRPIDGNVAFCNFEVSGATFARWADQARIAHNRLLVANLRGTRNPFNDDADAETFARVLHDRDVETVIVDPFGRAYNGDNQNDAGEVGAWLARLDAFARSEVGAKDIILAAHAGWGGERSRGSSALEDWGDSIITLKRNGEDDPLRYMSAIGRDVDFEEDALAYDNETRALILTRSGSRSRIDKVRNFEDVGQAICDFIDANPGTSWREIEKGVGGGSERKREARTALIQAGKIIEQWAIGSSGGGGKKYYSPTHFRGGVPGCAPGAPVPVQVRPSLPEGGSTPGTPVQPKNGHTPTDTPWQELGGMK